MPPGIQRPKSIRRFHRKSRTGCTECRSRRIKCDETRPSCGNCQRASMACHFSPQTGSASLREDPSCPNSLVTLDVSSPTGTFPTGEPGMAVDMLDLALMHHYTTVTSASLFGQEQQELWQIEIPIMARSSPLLMHALLATAALHLAVLHPDDSATSSYKTRALYHHGLGLGLFNTEIGRLPTDSQNSHILFTFGIFLVVWAYASFQITNPTDDSTNLDTLLASLELVRGNKIIFELQSACILAQPIGRFTQANPKSRTARPNYSLSPSLAAAVTDLRKQATDFVDSMAIDHLERFLLQTFSPFKTEESGDPEIDMRLPLGWPAVVDNGFWERLKRHSPTALLILMNYAIILRYYELRAWWMEGWSERLLGAVEGALAQVDGVRDRYDWGLITGSVWGEISKMK
ncbi:hypothetical protein BDV12DRAFT_189021 [Aspergillus spectabilis]